MKYHLMFVILMVVVITSNTFLHFLKDCNILPLLNIFFCVAITAKSIIYKEARQIYSLDTIFPKINNIYNVLEIIVAAEFYVALIIVKQNFVSLNNLMLITLFMLVFYRFIIYKSFSWDRREE